MRKLTIEIYLSYLLTDEGPVNDEARAEACRGLKAALMAGAFPEARENDIKVRMTEVQDYVPAPEDAV